MRERRSAEGTGREGKGRCGVVWWLFFALLACV
jgi:hypothetical protein